MKFELHQTDSKSQARSGSLHTDHGIVPTPIFMPVGTQATVKAVEQDLLLEPISSEIILANTYHLYLRPGTELLEKAGGIHSFMSWNKPLLTDSGGYQVYSLSDRRKITEEGARFFAHTDGSKHMFSPEFVMQIQRSIGADIVMAFDECTPFPCEYKYAQNSMHMTHRWLDRCISAFNDSSPLYGHEQCLAPIVQGSVYKDLRIQSSEYIASKGLDVNAIGGLSVGEPHELLYEMTAVCTSILPESKPRYLMGVGLPENILECISLGIDMFDCVLPSRNARHGLLYTFDGVINIKNAKWKEDFSAIDEKSRSSFSKKYSKAYLSHLFRVKEYLALQIATVHNLSFFVELTKLAREHINQGDFTDWKTEVLKSLTREIIVIKKMDQYIIKKYLSSFLFTMLLITMIAVVIDFSEKINRFIDADVGLSQILGSYYLNFIPWINGMMWPLFSLIAVIFFTSRMAKNAELVALLSSGVSFYRIMVPYLIAATLIAGTLWVGKNYFIPYSCKIKNDFENEYLKKSSKKTLNNDIHFFLSPTEKLYIRYYRSSDTTAQAFRLESFDKNRLIKVLKAEKLVFKSSPNIWTLKDYSVREFSGLDESFLVSKGESLDTVLDLTPEDFIRNTKLMENMTTVDLNDYINRERERGLGDAKAFLIEKHMRNSQPFTIFILTLIGFAISSRKVRGGMGLHLAIGVILGAAFVIVSKFAATFSNNLSLSPALGAWIPNLMFSVVALIIVRQSQK